MECTSYVLFSNCKHNIKLLSLLVDTTVDIEVALYMHNLDVVKCFAVLSRCPFLLIRWVVHHYKNSLYLQLPAERL